MPDSSSRKTGGKSCPTRRSIKFQLRTASLQLPEHAGQHPQIFAARRRANAQDHLLPGQPLAPGWHSPAALACREAPGIHSQRQHAHPLRDEPQEADRLRRAVLRIGQHEVRVAQVADGAAKTPLLARGQVSPVAQGSEVVHGGYFANPVARHPCQQVGKRMVEHMNDPHPSFGERTRPPAKDRRRTFARHAPASHPGGIPPEPSRWARRSAIPAEPR